MLRCSPAWASLEGRGRAFGACGHPSRRHAAHGSSESDSILPALALRFEAPCETSGEESDAGDQEPSFGAGDGCLVVLGEAAVASEPSVSAFDDPAFALRLECSGLL